MMLISRILKVLCVYVCVFEHISVNCPCSFLNGGYILCVYIVFYHCTRGQMGEGFMNFFCTCSEKFTKRAWVAEMCCYTYTTTTTPNPC